LRDYSIRYVVALENEVSGVFQQHRPRAAVPEKVKYTFSFSELSASAELKHGRVVHA
jgi:hypothetical protein